MANTLYDNIVVKSKLETVTKIEGQPALEKKVCVLELIVHVDSTSIIL